MLPSEGKSQVRLELGEEGVPLVSIFIKKSFVYKEYSAHLFSFIFLIGRGGQKFIERCVSKVSDLRARFPEKDIEVDGGVGPSTIDQCAHAGTSPSPPSPEFST